jgi:hypothetical protein
MKPANCRAGCLGLGIGPEDTEPRRDICSKSRSPHPLCWRNACLAGCPPSLQPGGVGPMSCRNRCYTVQKFALCRESLEEHMEQTSDETYLVDSLTAIDPPFRKIIHYRQGRQVSFEPDFPVHTVILHTISRKVLTSKTYPALTNSQPTIQPRGETHLPLQKIKPPPSPISPIGVHPALKYSATAYSSAAYQPTAQARGPRPVAVVRPQKVHRYSGEERGRLPRKRPFSPPCQQCPTRSSCSVGIPTPSWRGLWPTGQSPSLSCPLATLTRPEYDTNLVAGVMSRLTMGWGDTGWE